MVINGIPVGRSRDKFYEDHARKQAGEPERRGISLSPRSFSAPRDGSAPEGRPKSNSRESPAARSVMPSLAGLWGEPGKVSSFDRPVTGFASGSLLDRWNRDNGMFSSGGRLPDLKPIAGAADVGGAKDINPFADRIAGEVATDDFNPFAATEAYGVAAEMGATGSLLASTGASAAAALAAKRRRQDQIDQGLGTDEFGLPLF